MVFFETEQESRISQLGGVIKRGVICDGEQLRVHLQDKEVKIAGVDSNELGLMIKRNCGIRRYKILEQGKTDLEIKRKGVEVFSLGGEQYGLVM